MFCRVAIHHPRAVVRACLFRLLEKSFHVTECASTSEVLDAFRTGRVSALIIDGLSIDPSESNLLLQNVRRLNAKAIVCVYAGLFPGEVRAAVRAMQAGANEILFAAYDEQHLAHRIAALLQGQPSVVDRVMQRVGSRCADSVRRVIGHCLRHAHAEMSVMQVAKSLGVSRGTLLNHVTSVGFTPRELIGWCRTLVAADALDSPEASLKTVAAALEFPSPAAMRNRVAHYSGHRVSDLRSMGAFNSVLELFAERLIA